MKKKLHMMVTMFVTLLTYNGVSQENQTPALSKTFDLNQPGTLNARSSGGNIHVRFDD